MDFANPLTFLFSIFMTIVIFLIRPLSVKLSFWNEKIDKKSYDALKILIPKGLTAAVLAQVAIQKGIPRAQDFVNIVFSVVIVSIILTSILVFISLTKNNESTSEKLQQASQKTSKKARV